jgi:hypothetical protein
MIERERERRKKTKKKPRISINIVSVLFLLSIVQGVQKVTRDRKISISS